jgi:RNA polymerase sigma-70 factor (ECF subfamily)
MFGGEPLLLFNQSLKNLNMDPNTFSVKVREHGVALKAYALYLSQDREDAHDLMQETLLKAFTHRERFTDDTNLKGWLYTIMKNTFINQYRRKVKRNTLLDSTENEYYLNSSSHAVPNESLERLNMEQIHMHISRLPYDLKEAFMMNFRGYKYQEIADHFGIPIGTVKTRIHMARQILKKKLHVYGESYGMQVA